jgi:hypothetical protein
MYGISKIQKDDCQLSANTSADGTYNYKQAGLNSLSISRKDDHKFDYVSKLFCDKNTVYIQFNVTFKYIFLV